MPLSFYVLTYNSEKYLDAILEKVSQVAEDVVIVDSGSTDGTEAIARRYTDRFLVRPFDNFVNQRLYGIEQCAHEWILNLDSDEIPDEELIATLHRMKSEDFNSATGVDAYRITRYWHALGRRIRALYPVESPDAPVRLFRKSKAHFNTSNLVHETLMGFDQVEDLKPGSISHHTFETEAEIQKKLKQYTDLAAVDAHNKGKKGGTLNAVLHALGAFVKWYFFKRAYKDGAVGFKMGQYAWNYTYQKYIKLGRLGRSTN